MPSIIVIPPFEVFSNTDGESLEDGFIYVGTAGLNPVIEANRIQIYTDENFLIPIAQPVRTSGGYPVVSGSPVRLYASAEDYAILVTDKNGALVYSSLTNKLKFGSISFTNIKYDRTPTEIANLVVPVFDYYPPGDVRRYGAIGDGVTNSTIPLLNAIKSIAVGGFLVFEPDGLYMVDASQLSGLNFNAKSNFRVYGNNATIKVINGEPVVGGFGVLYFTGATDGYIENLTIDANRANRVPNASGAFNVNVQNSCARLHFKSIRCINAVEDGFTVTTSQPGTLSSYPTDITFEDCSANNSYRCGFSAIGSLRLRVIGGYYSNTNGSSPEVGIDVEPDVGYTFGNTDLLIQDCMVYGNTKGGIVITGPNASPNSSVTIAGVRLSGNGDLAVHIAQASNVDLRDLLINNHVGNASFGIITIGDPSGNVSNVRISNIDFSNLTSAGVAAACIRTRDNVNLPVTIENIRMFNVACPPFFIETLSCVLNNITVRTATSVNPSVISGSRVALRNIFMDTITGSPFYVTGSDVEFDGVTIMDFGASASAGIQFEAGATGSIVINTNFMQRVSIPVGAFAIRYNGVVPRLIRNVTAKSAGTDFTSITIFGFLSGLVGAYISDCQPDPFRLTGTWNPPNIAVGGSASTTFAIPGAALLDPAKATMDSNLAGLTLTAYVSAANTVTVLLANNTAGAIDLGNSNVVVWIEKR